jgi:hypothetical protein
MQSGPVGHNFRNLLPQEACAPSVLQFSKVISMKVERTSQLLQAKRDLVGTRF